MSNSFNNVIIKKYRNYGRLSDAYSSLTGFTLTEMIFTIAIILTILALILPVAKTAYDKMKIHQADADIAKLEIALESYNAKYGYYPDANPSESVPVAPSGSQYPLTEFIKFPTKQVISNIYYDPWNMPYRYSKPGLNHTNFVDIASAGPDRQINSDWQTDHNTYSEVDSADINDDNIDNWSRKR